MEIPRQFLGKWHRAGGVASDRIDIMLISKSIAGEHQATDNYKNNEDNGKGYCCNFKGAKNNCGIQR